MIALHTKSVSGLQVWKLGDYCTVYMEGGGGGTRHSVHYHECWGERTS